MSSIQSATNFNPKFFDTNIIESVNCTRTEPTNYLSGTGDLIDNIRDGRLDTTITLTPPFTGATLQPDGLMDSATGWTPSSYATLTTDTSIYIAGSASVKMSISNIGPPATMSKTFPAFDMSQNKLLWLGIYATGANEASAPIAALSVTLTDASSNTVTKTLNEINGNLPQDTTYWSDKWIFAAADFTGATPFDFVHVVGIKILVLPSGSGTPYYNLDGLRFGPADAVFQYDFSQLTIFDLLVINGLNCARYSLDISQNGTTWTNVSASSNYTGNGIILFEAINWRGDYTHFRLTLSFLTQTKGALGSTVANILLLPFLYEWDNPPKSKPTRENTITTSENDLGALTVNKIGQRTNVNMTFDLFTELQQNDLAFCETLFEREIPFWLWLNGNNANSNFTSLSSPWDYNNVFYMSDATQALDLGHSLGQADKANPTDTLTLNFVEAAYKRTGV